MLFQRCVLVTSSRLALSALAMAAVLAAPAAANPRNGAPIVYRGDAAPVAAPVRMAQAQTAAPVDKATARIDFRYPDQSGSGGVVTASAPPAPVAPAVREPVRTEAPQLILAPNRTVVETTALQSVPQTMGQGAPAALTPVQPSAPAAPAAQGEHVEIGVAVVYGEEFAGLPTANGETFSQTAMTAAHPNLPLPSLVHVTHLETGREVVVRVNDRGPFEEGANLQLSRQAANALGFNGTSKANVLLRYLGPAPVQAAGGTVSQTQAAPPPATALASAAPTPATATPTRRDVVWPVAAEDELMGGNGASAPAPRLMSLKAEPVKPAPAPAATYPVAAPGGDVYVQLASFTELGNAEAMLRRVEGRMPVEIVSARVNGADYFRVRVGPFDDRSSAEQVRARLLADGTADGRVVSGS